MASCASSRLSQGAFSHPERCASSCLYSAQVNSTARNPAPSTTAYTSLVRLNGTAALLTYDMLSSPRVMWSMELALAVGPQRGNQNA